MESELRRLHGYIYVHRQDDVEDAHGHQHVARHIEEHEDVAELLRFLAGEMHNPRTPST